MITTRAVRALHTGQAAVDDCGGVASLTGNDGLSGEAAPVLQVALESHPRPRGQLYLLTLAGDLDVSTSSDLAAATDHIARTLQRVPVHGYTVVVDLAELVFLDCAGLTALVALWHTTTRSGGTCCVLRARPQALRLFALTGADQVMPLCQDLVQALSSGHELSTDPKIA